VLEDVAHAVVLSPNSFSTLFKKVVGCSFRQSLARARIGVAQEMLARTDLPIKEIVFQVGFKDYNYFNRIFHLMTGMAPARFRHFNSDASAGTPRQGAAAQRKTGIAS
jgi:YesN/AraC family two-component response regulator